MNELTEYEHGVFVKKTYESLDQMKLKLSSHGVRWDYYIENVRSTVKIHERLAQLLLIFEVLKTNDFEVLHEANGRPFLPGMDINISISNSFPYVAVQLRQHKACGIDIQIFNPKIDKISSKFTSSSEVSILTSLGYDFSQSLHLIWISKEVIYKCMNTKGLSFKNNIHLLNVSGDLLTYKVDNVEEYLYVKYVFDNQYYIAWFV